MRFRRYWLAVLLAVPCLSGPRAAGAQDRAEPGRPAGASFWQAAAGVSATNWITWAYNWYVQRWPWAKVGVRSWGQNLRHGFIWDNDCFLDNQLAHPYHGSFYHNSARASGYGYWASVPFVAVGSAGWELFGENIRASLNDLVNTTLGGMAIGEVTYRLSSLLGSNRGAGRTAFGRELGAFALSPIARTQGLLHGRVDQAVDSAGLQPEERSQVAVGQHSGHPFLEVAVRYGSPFDAGARRPYDAFEFRLQVSPDGNDVIHHVGISGLLARRDLSQSAPGQLVFGVFQHYDYDDLASLKFSGHSVSGALLYRRQLGARNELSLGAHLEGILLAGISADHGFAWRRDYDLGPGAGARLGGSFVRDGREWLRLDGRFLWIHSIHGSEADHLATFMRASGAVPLSGSLGLGAAVDLTSRHSRYKDFTPVTQRTPEIRAYLTWARPRP
jgi:hypothetical protein